jgi:hypothetical protein
MLGTPGRMKTLRQRGTGTGHDDLADAACAWFPPAMSAIRRWDSSTRSSKWAADDRFEGGMADDRQVERRWAIPWIVTSSWVGPTPPEVKTQS